MRFRKVFGIAALSLGLALGLSGCLKVAGNVAIDADGETAKLSFSAGVAKENLMSLVEGSETTLQITDENICSVLQEELESGDSTSTQKWESEGDHCVTRSEPVAYYYNQDGEISTEENELVSSEGISIMKLDDRTVEVSLDSVKLSDTLSNQGESMGQLTYELSVTYPEAGATGTAGATVIDDGKTVSWDDESIRSAYDSQAPLVSIGYLTPDFTVPVAAGLGALGAAVIAGAVVVIRSRAKASQASA